MTSLAPWSLGVFAKVFPPQSAASLAATVADHGLRAVQLNLVALGLPTIPAPSQLAEIDLEQIAADFASHRVEIWGVSATYNMAHPDAEVRAEATARVAALVRHAPRLGATAVTLCTGSRDAGNMWRAHADNSTPEAWADMLFDQRSLVLGCQA